MSDFARDERVTFVHDGKVQTGKFVRNVKGGFSRVLRPGARDAISVRTETLASAGESEPVTVQAAPKATTQTTETVTLKTQNVASLEDAVQAALAILRVRSLSADNKMMAITEVLEKAAQKSA